MQDLLAFIVPGAPQQMLTNSSFIMEPQSEVYAKENTTAEFVWKIMNCNCSWQVRIVTEEYTLYPNWLPDQVPIKEHTDYNVTQVCDEEHINVTLSVIFNVKVLEYVEYFICKVFIENNYRETMQMSRVNLISVVPGTSSAAETTVNSESMTTTLGTNNVSLYTIETTTGSGCRGLCGHISALLLCLNLAILWMS